MNKTVCVLVLLLLVIGTAQAEGGDPSPPPLGDAEHPVQPPVPGYVAPEASAAPSNAPLDTGRAGDGSVPLVDTPIPANADPFHEAGAVTLAVRACVDLDRDQRCTSGEGVEGIPFFIVNESTGARIYDESIVEHRTNAEGRQEVTVLLKQRTSISIDMPYLALSKIAYQGQDGLVLVVPAPTFPEELP